MSRIKKRHQGRNAHRYRDNPLERKIALAWQEFNEPQDHLGHLLHPPTSRLRAPEVSDRDRKTANTVIQWLGSPVGFSWLCDTFGLEIVRATQERGRGGRKVEIGQVYASQDHRDKKKGRTVTVERLRYGYGHRLYKVGPYAEWAVRSSTTGRLSYVKEERLLDPTKWKLIE